MSTFKYEYIWLDGTQGLRSKTRIGLNNNPSEWNYDGSSTQQADGNDSEVILKPVKKYLNPFHSQKDCEEYLVLCETYLPNGNPHKTNTRSIANTIFKHGKVELFKPFFGIEHEFFVIDNTTGKPLGFPTEENASQGKYYCAVGGPLREFLDKALNKCMEAGVIVTGSNMEVCPGQAEIQVCDEGIAAGDDSIILKYILERLAGQYNYSIDFSAKPVEGDWNGSGCHVNFSTLTMREPGGYEEIINAIKRLEKKHKEHIALYGEDNKDRLTGKHETSSMETFTYGVADRGASIRIPRETDKKQCGYFEDRRPSSSADMYLVTSKIYETVTSSSSST
jgi:glutamine synthetase